MQFNSFRTQYYTAKNLVMPAFRLWTGLLAATLCVLFLSLISRAEPVPDRGADELDNRGFKSIDDWNKVAEVLDLIATSSKANFQRIRSWEGLFKFESRNLDHKARTLKDNSKWDGKPYWRNLAGTCQFALDSETESIFMTHEPGVPTYESAQNSQKILFAVRAIKELTVVTQEHELAIRPEIRRGELASYPCTNVRRGPVGYRRAVRPIDDSVSYDGRLVDPRNFYGNGSMRNWDWCKMYASQMRNGKFSKDDLSAMRFSVRTANNETVYKFDVKYHQDTPDPNNRLVITQFFSEKAGFNLVRWHKQRRDVVYENRDLVFNKVDGISYPHEITIRKFNNKTGGEEYSKRYTIEKCVFNNPIPRDKFSWQALDLKNGTRIVDEIANRLSVFQDGNLVDCEEYKGTLAAKPSSSNRSIFMWINVGAVFVLIVFIAAKRFKFSK